MATDTNGFGIGGPPVGSRVEALRFQKNAELVEVALRVVVLCRELEESATALKLSRSDDETGPQDRYLQPENCKWPESTDIVRVTVGENRRGSSVTNVAKFNKSNARCGERTRVKKKAAQISQAAPATAVPAERSIPSLQDHMRRD